MVPDRTLLLIFAHPDDESYLAAGTMARYARDGRTRVVLVTATRGEAATLPPEAPWVRSELPAIRAAELQRAADLLGIHALHLWSHADGALAATDHEAIRRQLVACIRDHRPDVVISFDPNGENLHRDHIAIGRFAADAVAAASDPRWYPDLGVAFATRRLLWTPPVPVWRMLREKGRAGLEGWPGADVIIDTREDAERKRAALLAHRSQAAGIERLLLGAGDAELVLSAEVFRMGWGGRPGQTLQCVFEELDPLPQETAVSRSAVPHGSRTSKPSP